MICQLSSDDFMPMKKQSKTQDNYIILPVSTTRLNGEESSAVANFLSQVEPAKQIRLNVRKSPEEPATAIDLKVLDSIHQQGAKLISISKEELADFRFSYPGLRIIKEKFYRPAVCANVQIRLQIRQIRARVITTFKILDPEGNGIPDVTVVIFTDFAIGRGASGVTAGHGNVKLKLDKNTAERIYIYPNHSYWGYYKRSVKLSNTMKMISTYPKNRYAVMDGTSMACPAAAGLAARLLAGSPQILSMPRNQAHADEMTKYLAVNIKSLGFGSNFEGKGMLRAPV
jgi:hypothetical protein